MLRLLREEHFYDLKTKKELNKQTKKKTKWNNLNYTSYRDFIKIVKFNPSIFLTIIFFAKVTINRSVFRKKLYFHNQQYCVNFFFNNSVFVNTSFLHTCACSFL